MVISQLCVSGENLEEKHPFGKVWAQHSRQAQVIQPVAYSQQSSSAGVVWE